MRSTIIVTSAITLATAVGCSGSVEVQESVGDTGLEIMGGSPATAPHHAAVVSLHQAFKRGKDIFVDPQIFCSGMVIIVDVVLTAAHCVNGTQASRVVVHVGDEPAADAQFVDHAYLVDEIAVHPSYSSLLLVNDVALLRLKWSITGVTPVAHLPQALELTAADIGITLDHAGFGVDDNGHYGVKLHVEGELAGFGCGHPDCSTSGDTATQIWYYQDAAHNGGNVEGTCAGDSGGPSFVFRNGTAYVAGITSYGDGPCLDYGVATNVSAFQGFIDAFIGGGGSGGGGGGTCELGAKGDVCTDGSDCCSGTCVGKPGNKTCK